MDAFFFAFLKFANQTRRAGFGTLCHITRSTRVFGDTSKCPLCAFIAPIAMDSELLHARHCFQHIFSVRSPLSLNLHFWHYKLGSVVWFRLLSRNDGSNHFCRRHQHGRSGSCQTLCFSHSWTRCSSNNNENCIEQGHREILGLYCVRFSPKSLLDPLKKLNCKDLHSCRTSLDSSHDSGTALLLVIFDSNYCL